MNGISVMRGDTCTVLAQVLPVFLLALIFNGDFFQTITRWRWFGLPLASLHLINLGIVECVLLVGVERGQLTGGPARYAWSGSLLAIVMVLGGVLAVAADEKLRARRTTRRIQP